MSEEMSQPEGMDIQNLYREDTYTDRKTGTIQVLTPVNEKGEVDESRDVIYQGQAQMMTPAGALPIHFEFEVDNLADAVNQFTQAAQVKAEETIKELQEMQREAASSIVVPGAGDVAEFGGGSGKIHIP